MMAEENKVQHSYDESDIQVLEGLEAVRKDQVCILVQHHLEGYIIWFGKLLITQSMKL